MYGQNAFDDSRFSASEGWLRQMNDIAPASSLMIIIFKKILAL
ncbi:hypothetical protein [Paenibacillus sp. PL91]|nr:hypothetical protein [Paenibacillus sp. PL91]